MATPQEERKDEFTYFRNNHPRGRYLIELVKKNPALLLPFVFGVGKFYKELGAWAASVVGVVFLD